MGKKWSWPGSESGTNIAVLEGPVPLLVPPPSASVHGVNVRRIPNIFISKVFLLKMICFVFSRKLIFTLSFCTSSYGFGLVFCDDMLFPLFT